jgi:general secretion pathway protein K
MDNFKRHINAAISDDGIALVIVLWVLAALMGAVLTFSFTARTESHAALFFKEGIEKKFFAEAGIQRGITELFYKFQNSSGEGSDIWRTDGTPYTVKIGDGYYTIRITESSGKIDINTASDIILRNLLTNLGIRMEEVDAIVDSIMDWRDPDDLHRLYGAESDYYMSLPNPYKAKNAAFDTLEELLLVKGVTPEILYGDGKRTGIIEFLTVGSKSGTININAAPRDGLMAIPGMTSEIADGIISYREKKEIKTAQEIHGILGEKLPAITPHINFGGTNVFIIEAVGYKNNSKTGYGIKAEVVIEGDSNYRYTYYKVPANTKQ